MDHEKAAATLAELGNTHRLSVFRFLVKAGHRDPQDLSEQGPVGGTR